MLRFLLRCVTRADVGVASLVLWAAGCATSEAAYDRVSSSPAAYYDEPATKVDDGTRASSAGTPGSLGSAADQQTPAPAESGDGKGIEAAKRLVIYTGSMALMVPVADVALTGFLDKVVAMGGYLQTRAATTVTVRVPAAQFFPTLELLRKSGTVTDEQVNATDVTKKVFDIELRLQTADEARKRLIKILESATRIEDVLAIEVQIRRLTEEMELMKGELRNLGDQIAFSTLTVTFMANAPAPRPYPDRTSSRFEWINDVGVEKVLYGF